MVLYCGVGTKYQYNGECTTFIYGECTTVYFVIVSGISQKGGLKLFTVE